MTDPLRLHYAPDNASLCVRLALEELRLPYETVLVDRGAAAQRSPRYLALNPNGLIPVIEGPEGPMFETAAILLWLADTHGALIPKPDASGRAHAVQWLFWLANTYHPSLRLLFYPDQYIADATSALRQRTRDRLLDMLALLETADRAEWLDADAPTVMSCYLGPMLRWTQIYGGRPGWCDLAPYPRLLAFAQRAEARAAVQRCAIAEGLGATPFSAPSLPNPPEGRAI